MIHLKIGFVLDDSLDKADGVQQYVLVLGTWLSAQGHEVHYLVGHTKRDDLVGIHSLAKNVAVRFNGNRMSMPLPASPRAIKELLAKEQFDILHVQLPYSPWLAARIIKAAGSKTAVVGTFHIVPHGLVVKGANRLLAVWTHSTLKRFDAVVSVSTAAQAFARKTFRLESSVLPNVVDYQRFSKAKPFEKYAGKLTVVFLGRLVPRKGCMLLLQAVSDMLKHGHGLPAFRLVICGGGPLEKELKTYVTEHHLESLVEFAGFVTEADKPRFLKSADIAIFPSTGGESFGIVLLEAMAGGHAAVLAGDNVGYRSVMQARSDLLFATKGRHALADKLASYLRDEDLRTQAARWGKTYARQFDVGRVGEQLVNLYNETLRSRHNVP